MLGRASPHLATIQQLWRELQAARNDQLKYGALAKRIREEADHVRQEEAAQVRQKDYRKT